MKSSDIPNSVALRGSMWPGEYFKKPGSQNDRTLFCWFNEDKADAPHVSVNIDSDTTNLVHFHVTFPVFKEVADPKASWRSGSTVVTESRYHVYLKIGDDDRCVVVSADDTAGWKRPAVRKIDLSFAGMQEKGCQFGDWFYAAALFQSAGG